MKIILDDRRPLPEDSREYNCLRTYEECAFLLRNIHLMHPTGVPKMREYAEKNFPNAELTFNHL